jgi:hypothetical protein
LPKLLARLIMKRERATTTPAEILIVKEGRAVLRQLAKWLAEGGYLVETKGPSSPARKPRGIQHVNRVATVTTRTDLGLRNGTGTGKNGTGAGNKNMHAAALGRLGGRKGGFARAARLTAQRRSEIARKAARARWRARSKVS